MNQITESALIRRINRRLAHDWQRVRKTRMNSNMNDRLGDFYLVGTDMPNIIADNIDLEDLAREIEVLGDYEQL